jgi:sigma-B regulation protein RsbU (phosphoserine phosphatase)
MSNKVLVVDDEPDLELLIRQKFRKRIQARELDFVFAGNGVQALDKLEADGEIDIVLTDINMPELDGLTLLARLNDQYPLLRCVIVSAYGDMANIRTAMNRGAFDFITKPIDFQDFEITMDKTLREAAGRKKAEKDRETLGNLRQELNVARRIQESILHRSFPPFPERADMEIHAEMIPAREVGGDFYDFFFIDPDRLGFVIGDVSGKGVPSALFMAVSKTLLKATALKGLSPDRCLEQVNRMLHLESPPSMFVSVFYGILDTRNGVISYSNGGHNCPYIVRRDGRLEHTQPVGGPVLAMLAGARYETGQLALEPGDAIFLFTDGVTEAKNSSDQEFSESSLEEFLGGSHRLPLVDVTRQVLDEVERFAGGAPQADDITVLTVRRQ